MASSSKSEFESIYDIFLSFRGCDTRTNFTDFLYDALKQEKFDVFRDNDEIPRGKIIRPQLLDAIMKSRMSVMVLSENYANSPDCLFELQLILKCWKTSDHSVLPVFYKVKPEDIKQQAKKLNFGEQEVTDAEVKEWSAALDEVSKISGMVLGNDGYETNFIKEIVGDVNNKLRGKHPRFVDHQASTDSLAKRRKIADHQGSNQILIPPTKEFVEFTKARNTENVWERLMNDEVSKIGIYGMGGIGKTTIVKHIHNKLISLGKFIVYWVTVSKPFSITNIQSDIAKAVKLSFPDDDDELRRARELYAKLSQNKKYVIIFDDLWEYFDLEEVGIPEPTQDNGCKIVLTTRSWEVCRQMDCASVEVKLLTEEEALTLFLKMAVIDDMVLDPKVKEVAADIAKECACLPLAIVTVGGSMRGLTDIRSWRNALEKLKNLTKDAINFEVKVLERLKFSYSHLGDKVLQDCFLYCSLYPEDHAIPVKELLELWIAKELIDAKNSVQAMDDEGHEILRQLTSRCLLESFTDVLGEEYLRMHDLIRDMVVSITRSSPRFMVKAGERLESIPDEDWSVDLEKISFMYSQTKELPLITPHVYPQLTTVLLNGNRLVEIPDSFFTNMPRVKILDLSNNWIESLPESIFNLVNLHALKLGACTKLRNVPSLENLKALTVFKLTWSKVKKLPEGIEELVNLVKLDLSCNSNLEDFPTSKICRLSKLRFLRLDGTNVNVSAEDLKCFKALKVVAVHFPNIPELTSYATSEQCQGLEKYVLIVAEKGEREVDITRKQVRIYSKRINPESESDSEPLESGVVDQPVLPANMGYFELYNIHNIIDLSTIPSLLNARDLRFCVFHGCRKLEFIFSYSSFSKDGQIFPGTVEVRKLPLSLQATAPPSPDKKKTAPPSLKVIRGGANWWEGLEWDDLDAKGILQPRFKDYFD